MNATCFLIEPVMVGEFIRGWQNPATGEQQPTQRAFGPGAMWDAFWMPESWRGPDGKCLNVILPDGHEWCIDAESSNCTRKGDRTHQCWVRHGEPPNLTVDKNGETCAAGAGSIVSPRTGWHGFLRNGTLEEIG